MVVVIGGGVVGLACAAALARRGRRITLLERHPQVGRETSGRGSGVIHAGLYYPATSLKARLCIEGRDRLYAFAAQHGISHIRCGKLVVAQIGEESDLDRLARMAAAAGARVEFVDRDFIRAREPHVRASAGLWSADTGWIDARSYLDALRKVLFEDAARAGGVIRLGAEVVGIETSIDGMTVVTRHERLVCNEVVNAAGLYADEISRLAGGETFTIYPCRGEYAELAPSARHLVRGLVYPVPHPSGHSLGVHLTRTLSGNVWIGPTARFQGSKSDYDGGRLSIDDFLDPTRALLPTVGREDLLLAGSGIRPKLHLPHEHFADFMIRRDTRNPRLIQVAGIESPGLTASLAIGEMVADL